MSLNRPGSFDRIVLPSGTPTRGGLYTPTLSGSVNPYQNTIQGLDDCKSWNNVRLVSGVLCPTAISGGPPYDDNIMFWPGCWGYDVEMVGTIYRTSTNGDPAGSSSQELEFLMCGNVGPNFVAMYEMMIAVHPTNLYADIVRWNGPQNQFTALEHYTAGLSASQNSWQFKAKKVGAILSLELNTGSGFSQIGSAHDTTGDAAHAYGPARYTGGLVGAGMWQRGGTTPLLLDFGWSAVSIQA